LGTLLGGEASLGNISSYFTPLSAFSFMAFCATYIPCAAAIATIKQEIGGKMGSV